MAAESIEDRTEAEPPASTVEPDRPVKGGRARGLSGEWLLVAVVVLLGAYVLIGTPGIAVNPGTENQNPRAYPFLIGILLVVAGIAIGVQVWRGRAAPAEEGEDIDTDQPANWRGVVILIALFAAHALLIGYIGWPLAAALLFGGTAVTLGARRWWAVAVAALALPVILLYVFWYGLSVYLPPGPLRVLMW